VVALQDHVWSKRVVKITATEFGVREEIGDRIRGQENVITIYQLLYRCSTNKVVQYISQTVLLLSEAYSGNGVVIHSSIARAEEIQL
jgi:hypothetical protein